MKNINLCTLAFLLIFISSAGASADCGVYLHAGSTYANRHTNTQGRSFDGRMTIHHTYACAEGSCFLGSIMFPAFNNGASETVAGYWSGNNIKIRRYVNLYSYVQTWSGTCGAGGVSGTWVIDPEAFNHGSFSLWY